MVESAAVAFCLFCSSSCKLWKAFLSCRDLDFCVAPPSIWLRKKKIWLRISHITHFFSHFLCVHWVLDWRFQVETASLESLRPILTCFFSTRGLLCCKCTEGKLRSIRGLEYGLSNSKYPFMEAIGVFHMCKSQQKIAILKSIQINSFK